MRHLRHYFTQNTFGVPWQIGMAADHVPTAFDPPQVLVSSPSNLQNKGKKSVYFRLIQKERWIRMTAVLVPSMKKVSSMWLHLPCIWFNSKHITSFGYSFSYIYRSYYRIKIPVSRIAGERSVGTIFRGSSWLSHLSISRSRKSQTYYACKYGFE